MITCTQASIVLEKRAPLSQIHFEGFFVRIHGLGAGLDAYVADLIQHSSFAFVSLTQSVV